MDLSLVRALVPPVDFRALPFSASAPLKSQSLTTRVFFRCFRIQEDECRLSFFFFPYFLINYDDRISDARDFLDAFFFGGYKLILFSRYNFLSVFWTIARVYFFQRRSIHWSWWCQNCAGLIEDWGKNWLWRETFFYLYTFYRTIKRICTWFLKHYLTFISQFNIFRDYETIT